MTPDASDSYGKVAKYVALASGALTWYACSQRVLPMPDDRAGPHMPFSFDYNLARGWYVFMGYCIGYFLWLLIGRLAATDSSTKIAPKFGDVLILLGSAPVFAGLYVVFMLPSYFLKSVVSFSDLPINHLNFALAIDVVCAAFLVFLTVARGKSVGKMWLVVFPLVGTSVDLAPYVLLFISETFALDLAMHKVPFVPTVLHVLAIVVGSYEAASNAQPVTSQLSPDVHAYMMKARRESDELIAVLSKCNSKQELLGGFARAAEIASTATGNEQLANACRTITSKGGDFSTHQLQVLRDDIVRNAKAFLASTEGAT